jgi:hypothetical protein
MRQISKTAKQHPRSIAYFIFVPALLVRSGKQPNRQYSPVEILAEGDRSG